MYGSSTAVQNGEVLLPRNIYAFNPSHHIRTYKIATAYARNKWLSQHHRGKYPTDPNCLHVNVTQTLNSQPYLYPLLRPRPEPLSLPASSKSRSGLTAMSAPARQPLTPRSPAPLPPSDTGTLTYSHDKKTRRDMEEGRGGSLVQHDLSVSGMPDTSIALL